jgi:hypothetical protein
MEENKETGLHPEKTGAVPLEFDFRGTHYTGEAKPLKTSCNEDGCYELDVTLNGHPMGTIYRSSKKEWTLSESAGQEMINKIGEIIELWYE